MGLAAAAWVRVGKGKGALAAAALGTGAPAALEVADPLPEGLGAAQVEASVAAFRRRLATAGAGDPVALDSLEDDLREAEAALGALRAWLTGVEEALRDPRSGRGDLFALAAGARPAERLEHLSEAAGGVRRRLAQLSARLP